MSVRKPLGYRGRDCVEKIKMTKMKPAEHLQRATYNWELEQQIVHGDFRTTFSLATDTEISKLVAFYTFNVNSECIVVL